jgi:hypothetical protein
MISVDEKIWGRGPHQFIPGPFSHTAFATIPLHADYELIEQRLSLRDPLFAPTGWGGRS